VSSPSGVRGRAPAENEFGAFCGRQKDADSNYLLNFCFMKHCSGSIAFRLERLQKFRWRSAFSKSAGMAFRLSLSTGYNVLMGTLNPTYSTQLNPKGRTPEYRNFGAPTNDQTFDIERGNLVR